MPECGLCGRITPKLKSNSHIVPKWMFKDTKNSKNASLSIYGRAFDARIVQDGPKRDFICDECESLTAQLDHFAAQVFPTVDAEHEGYPPVLREFGGRLVVRVNIDAGLLWKFVVSVILRGHASSHCEIASLKHFMFLRDALLSSAPLSDEVFSAYPVVLTDLENLRMVALPHRGYIDGHHYYQFFGAGVAFRIWVSNHGKPEPIPDFALKSGRPVLSVCIPIESFGDIRGCVPHMKKIVDQPRLRSRIDRWLRHG